MQADQLFGADLAIANQARLRDAGESEDFVHCSWITQLLVGLDVRELLPRSARPGDFDRDRSRVRPEAERQREIARRAIRRSAVNDLRLRPDPDHRADSVAIALRALQPELQPVIAIAAVVPVENRRAVIVRDQDVEIAVAIEIAIRRAARDERPG